MPGEEVPPSISSDRATHAHDISSRLARIHHAGNDEEKQALSRAIDAISDHGDDDLLQEQGGEPQEGPPRGSFTSGLIWMIINILATIGIVFTNKAIFSDPSLKLAQLTFACFHFLVTYLTLFILSRPALAFFTPRRVPLLDILPLSLAMSLNVILPNLSLAFSTVTFYQIARILLTPTVALLNYVLYGATLPRGAILALIPACIGVGMVSYYDSLPPPPPPPPPTAATIISSSTSPAIQMQTTTITTTTPLGIFFALAGTLASSAYTVLIGAAHRRLRLSSMQLLLNQAPVSAVLLLYAIPFLDTWPAPAPAAAPGPGPAPAAAAAAGAAGRCWWWWCCGWWGWRMWWWSWWPKRGALIGLSGLFAAAINVSQFFIVARAGPVSSTVVGHVKTCAIVTLGWLVSGRGVGDKGG
ncbi:b28cfb56-f72a-4d67-bf8b-b99c500918b7 [Thermothielavioides terrestris]|uniref:GDP-mannose transporter n=1 Tax=Thermothielavioides terrestris TaxID=2587410 RepID=A0A446BJZ9_9PEZI|nr:b28cfb56-f72a-4d67-bf8b-b99c500918b7 [Thermothielavioides terrestris]